MNKYFITPIRQRISTIGIPQSKLENWLLNWEFFFILGFGRSGTAFLSHFLNKAKNAYVYHEPVFEDFFANSLTHFSLEAGEYYLRSFRIKEIFSRTQTITKPGIYGEVNSTLRAFAQVIPKVIPNAKLLHLVRDGRDVVRSNIPRRTMTIRNPFSLAHFPMGSDPWKERWPEMDRFARICWFWQEDNRMLRTTIGKTIQFEKLVSDYDYFSEKLLLPLGLQIDKGLWSKNVNVPKNTTPSFDMPKWNEWTDKQKKTFIEICGDEMRDSGYEI